MLILSGSAHSSYDSLFAIMPCHKRKNVVTFQLNPRASKVLNSPPKRQSVWFQDRRVFHKVHRILHLPPDVWQLITHAQIATCNCICLKITKRRPLPSYWFLSGWKTALTLSTIPVLTTRMFAQYLGKSQRQKWATCHSSERGRV